MSDSLQIARTIRRWGSITKVVRFGGSGPKRLTPNRRATFPPRSDSSGKPSVCFSSNFLCRFTESAQTPTLEALSSANSAFKSRKVQLTWVQPTVLVRR